MKSDECAVINTTVNNGSLKIVPCSSQHAYMCERVSGNVGERIGEISGRIDGVTAPKSNIPTAVAAVFGGLLLITGGVLILVLVRQYRGRYVRNNQSTVPSSAQQPADLTEQVNLLEVEETTRFPALESVSIMLAKKLQKIPEKTDVWSLGDGFQEKYLEEVFTDLTFRCDTTAQSTQASTGFTNYNSILPKCHDDERIFYSYVQGNIGSGKTTFVKRLGKDWSKIHVQTEKGGQDSQLNHIKICIIIYLKDIKSGQSLRTVIKEQLELTIQEAELTFTTISQNQEKTLFVFDGYDRYDESLSSDISDIIHRQYFKNSHILITSRNKSSYHLGKSINVREYVLQGFTEDQVISYIKKACGVLLEKGLLQDVTTKTELENIICLPAFTHVVGSLYQDGRSALFNCGKLYAILISFVCAYHDRNCRRNTPPQSGSIEDRYDPVLIEMGDLAAKSLGGVRDIPELSKISKELGIFVQITEDQNNLFLSRAMEYYLVAYNFKISNNFKQTNMLVEFERLPHAHLTKIKENVKNIGSKTDRENIDLIPAHADPENARGLTSLQLQCLSEDASFKVQLPRAVSLELTGKFSLSLYLQYITMDASTLREFTLSTTSLKQARFVAELKAPNLEKLSIIKCNGSKTQLKINSTTKEMCHAISLFPLTSICVRDFAEVQEKEEPELDGILKQLGKKQELIFINMDLNENSVKHIEKCLNQSEVVKLVLEGCSLGTDTIQSLARTMYNSSKLEVLDLSENTADSMAHEQLGHVIPTLSGLMKLRLCDSPFDRPGTGNSAIAGLENIQRLKILEIGKYSLDNAGLRRLRDILERRKFSLKELSLLGSVKDDTYEPAWSLFFQSLKQQKELQSLNISFNDIDDEGMDSLISCLLELKTLRSLFMNYCGIKDSQKFLDMIDRLPKCPSIKMIDFNGVVLGHRFEQLQGKLKQLSTLEEMWVGANGLSDSKMGGVIKKLRKNLPSLTIKEVRL